MTDVYDEATQGRFRELIDAEGECRLFLAGSFNSQGAPLFQFFEGGRRRRVVAQRVAWEIERGPVEPGAVHVLSCGNQRCVRLDHLRFAPRGERVPESAVRERFWARVASADGDACRPWLKQDGEARDHYGLFFYRGKQVGAHRLAWTFANEQEIPDGMFVCHRCDNPPCCNPDHLFLDRPAGNSADMVTKGRAKSGEGYKRQMKLTDEQVREIRARYAAGSVSTHDLAHEYPVTAMVIWKVATGKSYRHVT